MEHEDDSEHCSSPDTTSDEFDSEFRCELCDKSFSGLKPLLQHEKGARHQRALRRRKAAKDVEQDPSLPLQDDDPLSALVTPFAECRPCGKEFSGPESYHQHLKGRSHKKRLHGSRLFQKVQKGALTKEAELEHSGAVGGSPPDHSGEEDFHTKVFQCEECLKAFTGVEPFYQHLLSKVHRRTLRQKGLLDDLVADSEDIDLEEDVLTCRMCRMSFSGPESAEAHLKGRGHLKKLEQVEWKKKRSGRHKTRSGDPQAGPSSAEDVNLQEDISHPEDTTFSEVAKVLKDVSYPEDFRFPKDTKSPKNANPQDISHPGNIILPKDTTFPEDAKVPEDSSFQKDTKFPKDTSHPEDFIFPRDTKFPKDANPQDINHPEDAECLNDANPQKFINQPGDSYVDETVPLDGSRLAEDTTESLEKESSVWV